MAQFKPRIGFIGQGWIGRNYADHFQSRGFSIVRYSQEISYSANKEKIKDCDIVFIAVPTPSTPEGFDDSIVREVVGVVGKGKIAVIKSTVVPGTTRSIQNNYRDKIVLHSPEFLREASARQDIDKPDRNIIGIADDTEETRRAAEKVMGVLPKAPYEKICSSEESELTKYGNNEFLYWKVLFVNILYDLAQKYNCDFEAIAENMMADPRVGKSHFQVFHKSNSLSQKAGRGAGGHCFIKDSSAFEEMHKRIVKDPLGSKVLEALRDKNIELLLKSGKDTDLLTGVYGEYIKDRKFNPARDE